MRKEFIGILAGIVLVFSFAGVLATENVVVLTKDARAFEISGISGAKFFIAGADTYQIELISASEMPTAVIRIKKNGADIATKELRREAPKFRIGEIEIELVAAGLGLNDKGVRVMPSATLKVKLAGEKEEVKEKDKKEYTEKITLNGSSSEVNLKKEGRIFTLSLISASDNSATLKVADSKGSSETKEITENEEKTILELAILLEEADENNLSLLAVFRVKEVSIVKYGAQTEQSEKREEKAAELKREAGEKIAEVKSKIENLTISGEKNDRTEIAIRQTKQLLEEAEKIYQKGNYAAALAVSRTAEARLELSQGEVLDNIEKKIEKREKALKEKEERLQAWEQKLNQRIERIENRIKELERFEEIIDKKEGRLNVNGKNITIKNIGKERREIIAGKINAKIGLNITGEEIDENTTSIAALLSNGKLAPVKIMPDRASLNALKKLKAKCEKEDCTIELKESGNFENVKPVYVVETEKDSRIFFIFPKRMVVRAEVDAETGEIINVKKPWWAFSAKEKNAEEPEIEADVGISENYEVKA